MDELRQRGRGRRESGAFLLGMEKDGRRRIERFVYYDDLDPHALDTGAIALDGSVYGPLWGLCRQTGLMVVADVHTHPGRAFMSGTDRVNPMVDEPGHIAIILPDYAAGSSTGTAMRAWGLYRYLGDHRWEEIGGRHTPRHFYLGRL